jgi:ribose transport system permease protein
MTNVRTDTREVGTGSVSLGRRSLRVRGAVSTVLQPVIPLILTLVVFGVWNPRFLSGGSIALMISSLAFVGIVSIGQTLLIIGGEFDLSVGSVAALSGYVAADVIMHHGWPIYLGLLAALVVGLLAGWLNGWVTTTLRVPSFIATFGMSSIALGIVNFYSRGESIYPVSPVLTNIGAWRIGGVSFIAILFLVLVVVCEIVLRRTRYGWHVFATGSSPETAVILGIRTKRVKWGTFVVVGGLAAVAGILEMMSLGTGNPSVGASWQLDSVATVVIGGTSLFGGSGSALGTLLGVLTFQAITQGIVAVGLDTNWQTFAIGVLMVIIVAVDVIRRRRSDGG